MSRAKPPEPKRALDLDSLLAYVYAPVLPLLKKITLVRRGRRHYDPKDILLPDGYKAELVASGFNAAVHCTFDEEGYCYVVEGGHKIEAKPRILKVDPQTGHYETFFEWPEKRWIKTGAVTGACWHQGYLYVSNTDTLSRIGPDGSIEDIVTGLPGLGDHQTNYPVVGPEGKLYWGQGSATNTGVVGADNFAYEWLSQYPDFHDVPAKDIRLVGRNYAFRNVLGSITEAVSSGAYARFGDPTQPDEVIAGNVKASGSVLRCNPDGTHLEVVAWGFRNPYGIAFHPDGRLFVTEHGIDERGGRYIVGDSDDFYEVQEGAWYGWPDFAAGIPLDSPEWGEGGQGREPVLAEHPDQNPPRPVVRFEPHAGSNGFAFSSHPDFGFEGDAFVALFGDVAPVTTPRLRTPAGFKVVRVDVQRRQVTDFAVNKVAGPTSKLPHGGFERPSHCTFGPDGALYVVDWGEIEIAPERGGIRMPLGTGALWRIRRTDEPAGNAPPPPVKPPLYALQYIAVVTALGGAVAWFLRQWRKSARRG